eukprot:symbB.v1.2.036670.t1/scaffold5226.1/size29636/1
MVEAVVEDLEGQRLLGDQVERRQRPHKFLVLGALFLCLAAAAVCTGRGNLVGANLRGTVNKDVVALTKNIKELDQQMDSSLKQRQDENAEYKEEPAANAATAEIKPAAATEQPQESSTTTEEKPANTEAGSPAEPSATGAATAETMPAAATEQPQENPAANEEKPATTEAQIEKDEKEAKAKIQRELEATKAKIKKEEKTSIDEARRVEREEKKLAKEREKKALQAKTDKERLAAEEASENQFNAATEKAEQAILAAEQRSEDALSKALDQAEAELLEKAAANHFEASTTMRAETTLEGIDDVNSTNLAKDNLTSTAPATKVSTTTISVE